MIDTVSCWGPNVCLLTIISDYLGVRDPGIKVSKTLMTDVWGIPAIPALGKLKQEDHKFEARLGYPARPCLKIQKKSKQTSKTFAVNSV
jgi:hypothetical protein